MVSSYSLGLSFEYFGTLVVEEEVRWQEALLKDGKRIVQVLEFSGTVGIGGEDDRDAFFGGAAYPSPVYFHAMGVAVELYGHIVGSARIQDGLFVYRVAVASP
jgi:hypothetical protein